MFEKIESKQRKLSPSEAERVLKLNTFAGQRNLNPNHIAMLTKYIHEGTFLTGNIAVAMFHADNGARIPFLVNGQHQCHAVLKSGKTIDVLYERYNCPTIDDVGLLYGMFDNHKNRSLQNLVHFEKETVYNLDWSSRVASLVVSGASLMRYGRGSRIQKVEKVRLLGEFLPQGAFINDLLTNTPDNKPSKETRHLRRGPVIHAILLTWDKSQKGTKEFWTQVRDGEGLSKSMPSFKLREFLKESSYSVGMAVNANQRRVVSHHEMVSKCITAWNAYRSGNKTILRYYPSRPIPRVA